MFHRTHTPETAPTPAPVYDFLRGNNDHDNPDLINNLRGSYKSTYESHYAHYWNDPSIAHEPAHTRRILAAEAAANQARIDTQTQVLDHITTTAAGPLSSVTGADHDDLLARYSNQVWGWLDTSEAEWVGDRTAAGLPVGNGMYDRLARDLGARNGIIVTPENVILKDKEAKMYSGRVRVEQARENYATMLSGKKTKALRRAYAEQLGHRVSKAEALEIASQEWRDNKLYFYDTIRQIRETELSGTDEEKRLAINTELIREDIREFKNLEVQKLEQMTNPKMGWLVQKLNKGNFAWRTGKNVALGSALFKAGALLTGATGGILAPAVAASLIGWRFYSRYASWQMRKEGVGEASAADASYYEAAMAQFSDAHKRTMDTQDIFARADDLAATLEQERKNKEQRSRIWNTAITAGTILLPRVIYEIPIVKDAVHGAVDRVEDAWDWVKDKNPWADSGSSSSSTPNGEGTTIDTTPDQPNNGNTTSPDAVTPDVPSEPSVPAVGELTPEQVDGLRVIAMRSSTGEYPWDRAVEYFNGDQSKAMEWLKEATQKAGGDWHNLGDGVGTNDWISINGASDTNTVWEALTAAHPVGR